jgi:hypothetical protein
MSIDCFCDYDPPRFYVATMPRAKKAHRCDECGGAIACGQTYENVSGFWEFFNTFKTCQRCVDLRTWVGNNVPCFCWAHGNLEEDMRETINEAARRAPDETRGLRFGFLRRIVLRNRAIAVSP